MDASVSAKDKETVAAQILKASEGAAPWLADTLNTLKPYAEPIGYVASLFIDYVGLFYIRLFQEGYKVYVMLPQDIISAICGLGLSFFGGAYCASISAIEAFKMCGWERTKAALQDIYADACAVYEAHLADSAKDTDGDGVRDVATLSANDLLTRKLAVAAMAVKDPEKLSTAVGGLYTSWLAVQAVLRLEFAKTITLGVSIATMVTPTLQKLGVPVLAHVVPQPYHHWIPLLVANTARAIGVAFAWKLQEVVSAAHLALVGGLLFARSVLAWARAKGYGLPKPEDTYLDEVVGYGVAALGFCCQFLWGMGLPFPLNLVFFPLGIVEWYLRWTITVPGAVA